MIEYLLVAMFIIVWLRIISTPIYRDDTPIERHKHIHNYVKFHDKIWTRCEYYVCDCGSRCSVIEIEKTLNPDGCELCGSIRSGMCPSNGKRLK